MRTIEETFENERGQKVTKVTWHADTTDSPIDGIKLGLLDELTIDGLDLEPSCDFIGYAAPLDGVDAYDMGMGRLIARLKCSAKATRHQIANIDAYISYLRARLDEAEKKRSEKQANLTATEKKLHELRRG